MRKASTEAVAVARSVTDFICRHAPQHKTGSENTIKIYRAAIKHFLEYLEQSKHISLSSLGWDCFSREGIEEWLEWLRDERGNAPSTCNVRLSALREFLRYVGERDVSLLPLYQESTAVKRLKCPKRKVEGLTRAAVAAVMAAPDASTRTGRRDLALMMFMYATAARVDEVLSVRVGDLKLDAQRPYVNVVGKGGKVRTLYLLPRATRNLKGYINEFHGSCPDPGARLFYPKRTDIYGKLTQPAVSARLRKHAQGAHGACSEVPLGLHAHQFRHARASHWLQDGVNIVQISFLLGHETLQTTMAYLDITTEDELKALELLETEEEKSAAPKWKVNDGSLVAFCSL
jgi:site-specific recombinase XerD